MDSPGGIATAPSPSGAESPEPDGQARRSSGPVMPERSWAPSRVALVAFAAAVVLTAALVLTTLTLYNRNEDRLLGLRARELGLVLNAAIPPIQTPLASAAALADATGGDLQRFRAFMGPQVGPGRQFASASLWALGGRAPLAVVGEAPLLGSAEARKLFAPGARAPQLSVTGHLSAANPSVGYEFSTPGVKHGFAIYTESRLPKSRRSKLERNSAFSDLDYAVYLGRSHRNSDLLVTSLKHLPISGRKASDEVPFGDKALTLVVTPRGSLGGGFFQSVPWIVAGFGLLVGLVAALITDRLARGRQRAERLASTLDRVAAENEQMYTEQRSIAQTLQHALLPDALPEVMGLKVSARYVPAAEGVEVGGDWYDVVAAGEHSVLLIIGDVSGHGLRAATTMASLRHATLAYAAQDASPAKLLAKLSDFVNSGPHDYFATVLCALIDVSAHRLTVASAGHLPPLLIDGADGRFIEVEANVPIGVVRETEYRQASVSVPANATLVAYTDGLVERRGEVVDVGLARLRAAATGQTLTLEELIAKLPRTLAFDEHHDDTAIVGIRWES